MAIDRDALLDALTERFREKMPSLATCSRQVKHWDDTPEGEQPALFVALGRQSPSYTTARAPAKWSLSATVYLYVRRVDDPSRPSLTKMLNEIEAALEWKAGDVSPPGAWPGGPGMNAQTTLGGKCSYARIAGDVVTDEGLLDVQQVAVLTVEMADVSA